LWTRRKVEGRSCKNGFITLSLIEVKKDGVKPADVIYVLLSGKVIEEYPFQRRLDQVPDSEEETEEKMKSDRKVRKCPECGGPVHPGYTEMVYDLKYRVRINHVPANICAQCGEVFITGRVASEVDRLVNRLIEDVESFAKSQPQIEASLAGKEIAIAV